jgi:predicted molibdopterin-dependent oxidoreductase YjgC
MFTRPIDPASAQGGIVTISFDGAPVTARAGDSVAAALLAAGHLVFRDTAVSGAPRGPFCMMGACFDCLVEIDGEPARQACMVVVQDGMRVARQHGAADYAARDEAA